MCVCCICEATRVLYCRPRWNTHRSLVKAGACARSTSFLPQSWSRPGWDLDSALMSLMGSLSQNGPSRLFLALPLPRRLRQPIRRPGGDAIWLDWCVFLEAHPSKQVLVDLGPGRPLRPLGSRVSAFNSSIVWSRKCLPALRQTASILMWIILFYKGAIEQSVIVWRKVK